MPTEKTEGREPIEVIVCDDCGGSASYEAELIHGGCVPPFPLRTIRYYPASAQEYERAEQAEKERDEERRAREDAQVQLHKARAREQELEDLATESLAERQQLQKQLAELREAMEKEIARNRREADEYGSDHPIDVECAELQRETADQLQTALATLNKGEGNG